MKRKTMKPKKDKKVFTNTANKTKKINVSPKNSRGGIRLWNSIYLQYLIE